MSILFEEHGNSMRLTLTDEPYSQAQVILAFFGEVRFAEQLGASLGVFYAQCASEESSLRTAKMMLLSREDQTLIDQLIEDKRPKNPPGLARGQEITPP